jgi:hypothetical protein
VTAHLLLHFKCKARKPLVHEVQRQQQSAGAQTLGGVSRSGPGQAPDVIYAGELRSGFV